MTTQETWLEPVLIKGKHIQLEPLDPVVHAAPMFEFFEPRATTFLGPSSSIPIEDVTAMQVHLEQQNSRAGCVHWAVRMLETGAVAGRVMFSDVMAAHGSLELGTVLMPVFWGGFANAESKLLLLTRAFEVLGANRVQFHVDSENQRSMGALLKIGVTKEGLRRQCQIRKDGSIRDLVMFSIIKSEWQGVKQKLEARVHQLP
jgi:N-acetyltransferase